jgi:hypothetical protein
MKRRRRTPSQRLAKQAIELSIAAPQVVAARVSRMAAAGLSPSAGDRNELFLMGAEKVAAAYQAWAAMWWQGVRLQFELAQSVAGSALGAGTGYRAFTPWSINRSTSAGARALSAGLGPVHRKAVRNARRLGRKRR